MAKNRVTPPPRIHSVPPEKARRERNVRLGLLALGLLVVIILAAGIIRSAFVLPRTPVAVVNGQTIGLREYEARFRYQQLSLAAQADAMRAELARLDPADESTPLLQQIITQQMESLAQMEQTLPSQTLELMIEDALISQEAQRRGITVSPEELEEQTELWFGYVANPTATPPATATATPTAEPTAAPTTTGTPEATATVDLTPTATAAPTATPYPTPTPMTLEAYQTLRTDYLGYLKTAVDMDEASFMRLMESLALREKLSEAMAAEVPETAPQVHVRQILAYTQEELDKVQKRLDAGEDFATIAAEVSQDTSSATLGGDVGWIARDNRLLPEPVTIKAFELQPGETAVVDSYIGLHLVEVLERDENRPLEPTALETARQNALNQWLAVASADPGVERKLSAEQLDVDTSQ